MKKRFRLFAALWAVVLVAAACGGDEGGGTGDTGETPSEGPAVFDTIGEGEGELNLVAWSNYTEKSWVKPFEDETGCKVNVTVRQHVRRDGEPHAAERRRGLRRRVGIR